MEVILSKQCLALTGCLGQGFGYYLQQRGERFFAIRQRGDIPPDGHWRFIVLCAELAQNKLHITDIRVNGSEIYSALKEAGIDADLYPFDFEDYNANWVLNFKNQCSL